MMRNIQKLLDTMFEIAVRNYDNSNFKKDVSRNQYMEWVREQFHHCGYDTEPRGSSWGVLIGTPTKRYSFYLKSKEWGQNVVERRHAYLSSIDDILTCRRATTLLYWTI